MQKWIESLSEFGYSSECSADNLDKTVTNVVKLLMLKEMSIATAESCTGGLLSALITSVPGASQVFELGVCTYSNRIKHQFLKVPEDTLAVYGAVSKEVALAMAQGLREQSGAELCVSVTGLAGPGGGTAAQPVGTVYAGFVYKTVEFTTCLRLWELEQTDRESIRQHAAACIFEIITRILVEDESQ